MADTLVTVLTRVDNYLQDGSNHQVKSRRGRPKYEIRWLGPQTSGYRKTRVKLQTLYDRRNQLSRDFRHRTTTEIVKRAIAGGNDLIVTEDLQIAGMTRSARGIESDPGRNVRAKSGLNRRILQQGWGNVQEMLDYKAARAGIGHLRVYPGGTSQTCGQCGTRDAASRVSQAEFRCSHCRAWSERGHQCFGQHRRQGTTVSQETSGGDPGVHQAGPPGQGPGSG